MKALPFSQPSSVIFLCLYSYVKAEHDVDARPILVVVEDATIVDRVNTELQAQLATLSTAPVAREAVSKGFAVVAKDIDEAIAMSDKVNT